jgi:hypothetical protein
LLILLLDELIDEFDTSGHHFHSTTLAGDWSHRHLTGLDETRIFDDLAPLNLLGRVGAAVEVVVERDGERLTRLFGRENVADHLVVLLDRASRCADVGCGRWIVL